MIESQYNHLIKNARNINPDDYASFKNDIQDVFQDKLNQIPHEFHSSIYPINYHSRLEFIESRPNQYHSVIQLKSLYDEFIKRYAAFCAKYN